MRNIFSLYWLLSIWKAAYCFYMAHGLSYPLQQSLSLNSQHMEKLFQQPQGIRNLSALETISVLITYETLGKQQVETIELSELLEKFPTSQAGRVYKNHNISFLRCLRVFFMNHFNGMPEALYGGESIDGLTNKEIKQIETLVLRSIKY